MPPSALTGKKSKSIAPPAKLDLTRSSAPYTPRLGVTYHGREKHDSGEVTPVPPKTATPDSGLKPLNIWATGAGFGRSERRPASSGRATPKDDVEDRDDLHLSRRWSRDKRRESKASVHGFEGPVLGPKTRRQPSLQNPRHEDGLRQLSYAQACSVAGAQQHGHIQTVPAPMRPPQTSDTIIASPRPLPVAIRSRETSNLSSNFSTEVSDLSSSIFDKDPDDAESLSATEPEIDGVSISPAQSAVFSPELEPDDRFLRPKQYFEDLENLEATVAGNSGLFLMSETNRQAYPGTTQYKLKFSFNSIGATAESALSLQNNYDGPIMKFCHDTHAKPTASGWVERTSGADLTDVAFHLLECRNLLLSIRHNVERMRCQGYCGTFFSAVTLDPERSDVAKLIEIPLDKIKSLHETFEDALEQTASLVQSSRPQRASRLQDPRNEIGEMCKDLLTHSGLPAGADDVGRWRRTILFLDLASISYCGAHIERFDDNYLGEDLNFAKMTPAWTYDRSGHSSIMLRRRRLRCLDQLLQKPVWVFQESSRWAEDNDLYLSAEMAVLADIWGPMWIDKPSESSGDILRLHIGSGIINAVHGQHGGPKLIGGEVLCHWHLPKRPQTTSETVTGPLLKSEDRLLIGAGTLIEHTTSQLKENHDCQNRTSKVIQQLRATHQVQELGTSSDERFLAEECYTASFGYSGVQVGMQKTYKRRSGLSLKSSICEAWKHGSSTRNPAILEQWIGLEVSFCSGNARRRRLKDILASKTMINWLDRCKQSEKPSVCENAFYEAVYSRDPKAFTILWHTHKEWRQELGQLVSYCLEGLTHSNVDAEGHLHLMWMPQADKQLLVKVKQNKHAWTSLLRDSRDHCAFSVMSGKCLHTDYKYASRCQTFPADRNGVYTVLETALVVNEKAPRPSSLELRPNEKLPRQARWSITRAQPGEKFQLQHGRLNIREPLFGRTRLLVEWEQGLAKKLHEARKNITKTVGIETRYHWELKDDEEWGTKPIPLFVISQKSDGR